MRKRKKGKNSVCAVKLDMMKAYDRVEWHYLQAIMLKLGFSSSFVWLIMKCVTSVRFTVRVNGELLPYFSPSRGFAAAFDGAQLTREIILLRPPATVLVRGE
jgi:hypothetical protein